MWRIVIVASAQIIFIQFFLLSFFFFQLFNKFQLFSSWLWKEVEGSSLGDLLVASLRQHFSAAIPDISYEGEPLSNKRTILGDKFSGLLLTPMNLSLNSQNTRKGKDSLWGMLVWIRCKVSKCRQNFGVVFQRNTRDPFKQWSSKNSPILHTLWLKKNILPKDHETNLKHQCGFHVDL